MSLLPEPSDPRGAWMLVPASRERFDGIRDYAAHLSSALQTAQSPLLLTTRDDVAPAASTCVLDSWRGLLSVEAAPRALYFHYQPSGWLRRDLLALLRAVDGLRAAGTRIVAVFHEYQLDRRPTLRRAAARMLFGRLGRAVAARANVIVATYGYVARRLEQDGLCRHAPLAVIPVGSNIAPPAAPASPVPGAVVMFGQPAGMTGPIVRAAAAALRGVGKPPMTWVCRDAGEAADWLAAAGVLEGTVTLRAALDAGAVSAELSRAAVAFAPIVDGVSTRRSTLAACLQHSLPVAGTIGRATDPIYRDSPAFSLSAVDDAEQAARALLSLLDDDRRRQRMSEEARRLFDAHLSWPRIADRFLALAD